MGDATTNRQTWIKNYEEVARKCGVGIRSDGRPVSAVGYHAGESIQLLAVPSSRPASAASINDENKRFEAEKDMERLELGEKKKQKESKTYILPEVLSPRDGHARMRNVDVLKGKGSRLWGPSRGTGLVAAGLMPARQAPVSQVTKIKGGTGEESDEEFEDQVEEQPKIRLARLQAQPMRRSTVVASPAARRSVFPPRNHALRSHAAELRAASVSEVSVPPSSAPEMATKPQGKILSRPSRPTSSAPPKHVEDPSPASSQESVKPAQSSAGPIIPFGPNLGSKIGVAIRSTTTSSILSSLKPFITSFEAFNNSRLQTLPPPPSTTIEAVRSYREGEKNKLLFITKWVDYTNKYGVAYILTDGTCTAMFNDNTSLAVDGTSSESVEFITQSAVSDSSREIVFRRLETKMSVLNEKKKTSKGLARKLQMWKRFRNYMKTDLENEEQWSVAKGSEVREPTLGGDEKGMLFATHYTRLKKCALFRFSDGSFQVCFLCSITLIRANTLASS